MHCSISQYCLFFFFVLCYISYDLLDWEIFDQLNNADIKHNTKQHTMHVIRMQPAMHYII